MMGSLVFFETDLLWDTAFQYNIGTYIGFNF